MVMPFCAKIGALKGNPFHWAAAGDAKTPRPRQARRTAQRDRDGFMVAGSLRPPWWRIRTLPPSTNLRDEMERARVVGGGVAQRVLQLPADPVHAPVITRRRAAGRARRHVRPRGITHLRV